MYVWNEFEIIYLKWLPNLQGAKELKLQPHSTETKEFREKLNPST